MPYFETSQTPTLDGDEYERIYRIGKPMETKDKDITYSQEDSLCHRCQRSFIIKAKHNNHRTIYCTKPHSVLLQVPDDIEECNRFEATGELDLFSMSQIAHVIEFRKQAGFEMNGKDATK